MLAFEGRSQELFAHAIETLKDGPDTAKLHTLEVNMELHLGLHLIR